LVVENLASEVSWQVPKPLTFQRKILRRYTHRMTLAVSLLLLLPWDYILYLFILFYIFPLDDAISLILVSLWNRITPGIFLPFFPFCFGLFLWMRLTTFFGHRISKTSFVPLEK
jgi:hypothetical protein